MVSDDTLETALRNELSMPAGEDDRIHDVIERAKVYVAGATGHETIPDPVYVDCVVGCAADLYNSRNARLGIMDATGDGVEPYRVPTDPLRSVWPKLNAIGIMCGGSVIA